MNNKNKVSYVNASIELSQFGGNAKLISNNSSLSSYYELFNENEVDNTCIIPSNKISDVFDTLNKRGYVGIVLNKSNVWIIYFRGAATPKDRVMANWFILQKFRCIFHLGNFTVYYNLLEEARGELEAYLGKEQALLFIDFVDEGMV